MIEARQLALDAFIDKQAQWVTQIVQQYRDTALSIPMGSGQKTMTRQRRRASKTS